MLPSSVDTAFILFSQSWTALTSDTWFLIGIRSPANRRPIQWILILFCLTNDAGQHLHAMMAKYDLYWFVCYYYTSMFDNDGESCGIFPCLPLASKDSIHQNVQGHHREGWSHVCNWLWQLGFKIVWLVIIQGSRVDTIRRRLSCVQQSHW